MTEKIKVKDNSPIPEQGEGEIKPEQNSIYQQPKNLLAQKVNEFKGKLDYFKKILDSERHTNKAESVIKEIAKMAIEAREIMEKAKDDLPSQLEEINNKSLKKQLTDELSDIELFNNYYSYLYDNGIMTLTPTIDEPDAGMRTNDDSRYGNYDSLLNKSAHTEEYDEILLAIQKRQALSKSFLFEKSFSPSHRRIKGFDFSSLDLEFKNLLDRFPENMRLGVLSLINEMVGKFSSTAICMCGDTGCWENAPTGNYATILGNEIGLIPMGYDYYSDEEKSRIIYAYLKSMKEGDQSIFEKNGKKLSEKISAEELKIKLEKEEEETRKQKEKEERKEKSPGFKALLEAAEKISYEDKSGGRAVRAFQEHLEVIAEYAEKLEALGFKIIVEQERPDQAYGSTKVILERNQTKRELYLAFNDTYGINGYRYENETISRIKNDIETILETAKMF